MSSTPDTEHNKSLSLLSTALMLARDGRIGPLRNPLNFIAELGLRVLALFRRLLRELIFLPSRIEQFLEARRRSHYAGGVRPAHLSRLHTSALEYLIFVAASKPSATLSFIRDFLTYKANSTISQILFRLGYWHVLRHRLASMYRLTSVRSPYVRGLVLAFLVKFFTLRLRWACEYAPYEACGLLLVPASVTGGERYLGNPERLTQSLRTFIRYAARHNFFSSYALLMEIFQTLALVNEPELYAHAEAFFSDRAPLHSAQEDTLAAMAQTLLKSEKSHHDISVVNLCHIIFRRRFDEVLWRMCICKKISADRLFPERTPRNSEALLHPAQTLQIHFDLAYHASPHTRSQRLSYQALHMHHFTDTKLCDEGLLIKGDYADTRFMHLGDQYISLFSKNIVVNAPDYIAVAVPKHPTPIDEPVYYCGHSHNYYHWLVECMPRFVLALAHARQHGITPVFAIPKSLKGWQIKMLAAIGVKEADCRVDTSGSGFLCKDLRAPDLPSHDMLSHPATASILKSALPAAWFTQHTKPRRKLYLSRKLTSLQRLGNNAPIEKLLTQHGYETVYPETMSFPEQIALFASASHVVAIGGAAITNCMFMQPGTKALILGPVDQIQPGTFSPLAEAAGVKVTYLACDSRPIVNRHYIWTVFTFDTDLKDLAMCLDELDRDTPELAQPQVA